jgi:SAM-dependent methyltransferase
MASLVNSAYRSLRSVVSYAVEGKKEYARLGAAMTDLLVRATAGMEIGALLDVGCGEGGYTMQHVTAVGVPVDRVYGVEYHPEHLKAAGERFRTVDADLETEQLPFEDGSMDVVICNQVLEHMKNIFWLLAELDRVLTVGGVLAIGVPNLTSLINRVVLLGGRQPVTVGIEGPHVRGFAHRSLRDFLLRHQGFELELELGSSLYPWPARLGAERLARQLPALSAYSFYALRKRARVEPCPWLEFATDGETSYTHSRAVKQARKAT